MEEFKIKYPLILGFFIAFVVLVLSFDRVHAYDDVDIYHDLIYHRIGEDNYSGTPFYTYQGPSSPQYTCNDVTDAGILFSVPVPAYADGDHVSIFFNVTFEIREIDIERFNLGFFVSPSANQNFLAPASGVSRLRSVLDQYNYAYLRGSIASRISYTFSLWGDATCTENAMYSLYKEHPNDEYIFFNAQGILDINVSYPSSESRPIYLSLAAQTIPDYALLDITYRGSDVRVLDSQYQTMVLASLTEISDLLTSLDLGTGLSDIISRLDTIISRLQPVAFNLEGIRLQIRSLQDELLNDDETDPDLTEWGAEASSFSVKVEELNSVESELLGTISDFTFPEVVRPSQTMVSDAVLPWFSNPIVIALTLAALALMVVFVII